MSRVEYRKLTEMFANPTNTQLMRQTLDLFALKYLKIDDLLLIHSYFHKQDGRSENILFSAPAVIHKICKTESGTEITIKALKDRHDAAAIWLVRNMAKDEMEAAYSHLAAEFHGPKIANEGWDNWVFAYNLPPQEKIKKRKQRTISKAISVYKSIDNINFDDKSLLFLGCGDGDEISAFIEHYAPQNARITGIDQSAVAVQNCASILPPAGTKLDFLKLDLDFLDQLTEQEYDYIFAFGLFDRETLSFQDGYRHLQNLRRTLKFKNLIVSGYSFDLFNSDEYRKMGFEVTACCNPSTMFTQAPVFYYILSDTERQPEELSDKVAIDSTSFYAPA